MKERPVIAATGLTGMVGAELTRHLAEKGHRVTPLLNTRGVPYRLGDPVSADSFRNVDVFFHIAYDFRSLSWEESKRVNVEGSIALLEAAQLAHVSRTCFVSSLSAYAGARSVYGRSKYLIEEYCRTHGITVVRPGLIANEDGHGIFGKFYALIQKLPIVPLLGNGHQLQYLVHKREVAAYLASWAFDQDEPDKLVYLAHPNPFEIRKILECLQRRSGLRRAYLPIPQSLVFLCLRAGESLGLSLPFRSDSLIGLLTANPELSKESFVLPPIVSIDSMLDGVKP